MAWETLIAYIDAHILDKLPLKISADDDHNPTLQQIVSTFGQDYIYCGVANQFTRPIDEGNDDDNLRYYIADGTIGTYPFFLDSGSLALTVSDGEFAIFKGVNNVWVKDTIDITTSFLSDSDTPTTYATTGGYGVFVNSAETGLEFINIKRYTEAKDDKVTELDSKLLDVVTPELAVPYTGATKDVDLGVNDLIVGGETYVEYADVGGDLDMSTDGTQIRAAAATVGGKASLRIPHGTTPTTVYDGDVWTDVNGVYIVINGVTHTFEVART